MKFIIVILCALFIQGCNNYMQPDSYNKAEELCGKYNEKVTLVQNNPLFDSDSILKLTINCTNNITIRSAITTK